MLFYVYICACEYDMITWMSVIKRCELVMPTIVLGLKCLLVAYLLKEHMVMCRGPVVV